MAHVGNVYNTYKIDSSDRPAIEIDPSASSRAEHVGHYSYKSIQPVETFVPRPTLREKIREQLQRPLADDVRGTRVVVVSGLGGAGKTQLVLGYLRKYQSTYKAIFWIDAGQQSSIDRDFMNIYHLLFNIHHSNHDAPVSAEIAIVSVKNWISSSPDTILLVLDGADEVEDTASEHYVDLHRLIPSTHQAHVIVTTRSHNALGVSSFEGVRVKELEPSQAAEVFRKSANLIERSPLVDSHVDAIVDELGYLALAVNLAGTYISQTPGLSVHLEEYLTEYRRRRRQILNRKPSTLVHQYGESVMTTWETSFAAIHRRLPAASRLLTLLAFLDNSDIFMELFGLDGSEVASSDKLWLSLILGEDVAMLYELESCFSILESFCLVQRGLPKNGYAMHKLVHTWSRDRLFNDQAEEKKYCTAAFTLLDDAVSHATNNPEDKLRFVPHLMANFIATKDITLRSADYGIAPLDGMVRIARFLERSGYWSNAELIRRFILEGAGQVYGDIHPRTLDAMDNLA
ncbi:hypothetical protein GQ53DRAFT_886564, partial [Thozetella sp. PMI_491]